jgi:TnpA family transposase
MTLEKKYNSSGSYIFAWHIPKATVIFLSGFNNCSLQEAIFALQGAV